MSQPSSNIPLSSHVVMAGTRVPFTIRKNPRARRVLIKMEDHSGLVLVLPSWASSARAQEFMRRHQDWVLTRLVEHQARLSQAAPPLGSSRTLVYRGRPISLRVRNCACSAPKVEWHRDHVLLHLPKDSDPMIPEILEAGYRDKAREVFQRRAAALSEHLAVRPRRIEIRDQKTRWGACTGRGTLTFNWRLILAPPAVLDYVVVHELSHLRHANHGRRFWELVASVCPQFEAHRAWLREHGTLLRAA